MGFRAALARDMVEGRAQKALLLSLLRRSLKAPHHLVYQTPQIPKRRAPRPQSVQELLPRSLHPLTQPHLKAYKIRSHKWPSLSLRKSLSLPLHSPLTPKHDQF